jgi:hypothetical protein
MKLFFNIAGAIALVLLIERWTIAAENFQASLEAGRALREQKHDDGRTSRKEIVNDTN